MQKFEQKTDLVEKTKLEAQLLEAQADNDEYVSLIAELLANVEDTTVEINNSIEEFESKSGEEQNLIGANSYRTFLRLLQNKYGTSGSFDFRKKLRKHNSIHEKSSTLKVAVELSEWIISIDVFYEANIGYSFADLLTAVYHSRRFRDHMKLLDIDITDKQFMEESRQQLIFKIVSGRQSTGAPKSRSSVKKAIRIKYLNLLGLDERLRCLPELN